MEKDMMDGRSPVLPWNGSRNESGGNGCGCDTPPVSPCPTVCRGYEGCGEDSWGLHEHPLAMVYAPCQSFRALYDPATALSRGTLFTELDLPLGEKTGGLCTENGAGRCRRS